MKNMKDNIIESNLALELSRYNLGKQKRVDEIERVKKITVDGNRYIHLLIRQTEESEKSQILLLDATLHSMGKSW